MRYLKLASAKNPSTDFIELNDLQGFLCTSFSTIGINRQLDMMQIRNRQFAVDNQVAFKKYGLSIEILSKYSIYEDYHRKLLSFLDRNKKDGIRLYYRPYDGMDMRYCLCEIESSQKSEKMKPIVLTLAQCSLWLGETKNARTSYKEQKGNLFAFDDDGNGYYSVGFREDDVVKDYHCVSFFNNINTNASIVNNSYNEVPLLIRIYGKCFKPSIFLFKSNDEFATKEVKVNVAIEDGFYVEINSNIRDCGVWLVNENTKERIDLIEEVDHALGSPFIYIDNGEHFIQVKDDGNNTCVVDVFWNEEYNE
jgi:hypothetical protein